ncbi:transcriptional regulator [Calothrix sp. NIES-4071]|nr:transcriptional regulator [Calothrix sp. NIES-4071]BAZ63231.1 transcriptional regulator [Calothrix sp. NIES-4105]
MPRPKGQTLTQKDIVEAAIACLHKEGESALGINRVARELGIQPPSIYNHFASFEELRRAVVLEGWRRFLDVYFKNTEGIEDRNSLLKTAAYTYRNCARESSALYIVVTNYPLELEDPEFIPIIQRLLAFYDKVLGKFSLSQNEIIHAARMFNTMLHGFVLADKAGLFLFPESVDDSFDWMVETLIYAIERRGGLNDT